MAASNSNTDASNEEATTPQHISFPNPGYILLGLVGVIAILYVFYKFQLHRKATAHVRLRKKHPLPPIGYKPPEFRVRIPHEKGRYSQLSPELSTSAPIPMKPFKPLILNPQTLRSNRGKVNALDSLPVLRYDQGPSKREEGGD